MTKPDNKLTIAKFDELMRIKRADMKLRPTPAPQIDPVAEVPTLALAGDKARREAERMAGLAATAQHERETQAKQEASRWSQRAERLEGFPPRAVADLARLEGGIFASDRFKRLSLAARYGGLIGLRGMSGTGKTTEACALARWYILTFSRHATYAKADDYLGAFRLKTQGYNARVSQADWIGERTRHDGLLILDELDKVPGLYGDTFTAKQHGFWLEAILDARYAAGNRPTMLCANFDDATWAQYVPPATRDRFKADGVIFNYGGPSLRTPTRSNA